MSSDFRDNAVALYISHFLNKYSKDKFEIFCFYAKDYEDKYTRLFKSYIPINNWFDVDYLNPNQFYELIVECKIDILVDLIGLGPCTRFDTLAKKPANIIISYLGFPSFAHLSEVDYRIVDNITDAIQFPNREYCEKLLKLDRCFICYNLYENVILPDISYKERDDDIIRLCTLQRVIKWHPLIRKAWLNILNSNPRFILYIKKENSKYLEETEMEMYKLFPQKQIVYVDYSNKIEEFLSNMNEIDIMIDTYPYSGTATSCSSLVMGVPIYTIYDVNNAHVSNVTASLIKHMNLPSDDKYICKDIQDYENKIKNEINNKRETMNMRIARRNAFMKMMDSDDFMAKYEKLLLSLMN